jgi:hypothetical protein
VSGSSGLRLVQGLARQLGGTFEVTGTPATRCSVRFSNQAGLPRKPEMSQSKRSKLINGKPGKTVVTLSPSLIPLGVNLLCLCVSPQTLPNAATSLPFVGAGLYLGCSRAVGTCLCIRQRIHDKYPQQSSNPPTTKLNVQNRAPPWFRWPGLQLSSTARDLAERRVPTPSVNLCGI